MKIIGIIGVNYCINGEKIMNEEELKYLEEKTRKIKTECLEMCIRAKNGHVTSAFSCAEIVVALYYRIMNLYNDEKKKKESDKFIMSKNHGSVIVYPILADLGYIPKKELMTFLQDGSLLGSHTKMELNGVDFAGGSLGIGLGVACGMAYAAKCSGKQWITYAILGDGECYEGAIWESALFAGHNRLNNLVVFVDRNNMCVTNYTEEMLELEPMTDKWRAFQWDVKEIDGHNFAQILDAVKDIPKRNSSKPLCIICSTIKGNGIDFMSNKMYMHGVTPTGIWAEKAIREVKGK